MDKERGLDMHTALSQAGPWARVSFLGHSKPASHLLCDASPVQQQHIYL